MTIKKTVAVLSVATSAALAFVGCGDFGTNLPFSGCTPVTGNLIIANANTVRGCDIDTLAFVSEITPPSGVTLPSFGGFDDGRHMVADPRGGRLFITHHDSDFDVYDTCLNPLTVNWGVSLSEPLGLAVLPNGQILVSDEEDSSGPVYRLSADLSSLIQSGSGGSFDGAEGIAYNAANDRLYIADEDDGDIEIFSGSTLTSIATVSSITGYEGPYWLAVDPSESLLFELSDDCRGIFPNEECGIFVYDIVSDDSLSYLQTLTGSSGPTQDCFSAMAVSEQFHKLFAVDSCNDTIAVFDTTTLTQTGTVPAACTGPDAPTMVAVTE